MKYQIQYNIGKCKYVVNYHKEGKYHSDGSEFYDIRIFNNKKKMKQFIKKLNY